jgi:hypothetical protein
MDLALQPLFREIMPCRLPPPNNEPCGEVQPQQLCDGVALYDGMASLLAGTRVIRPLLKMRDQRQGNQSPEMPSEPNAA